MENAIQYAFAPFLKNSSLKDGLVPNLLAGRVSVSLVCESNVGFSMRAFTKIHI